MNVRRRDMGSPKPARVRERDRLKPVLLLHALEVVAGFPAGFGRCASSRANVPCCDSISAFVAAIAVSIDFSFA